MRGRTRSVSICRFPEQRERFQNKFIDENLGSCIIVDRPSVVLDCSTLRVIDEPGLYLLLCCLEEAMKRNGDVRLAALHPEVLLVLRSTGVDSLFQCFETVSEAVESYQQSYFDFDRLEQSDDGDQQSSAA